MSTAALQMTITAQSGGHVDDRYRLECDARGLEHECSDSWTVDASMSALDIDESLLASATSAHLSAALWQGSRGLACVYVEGRQLRAAVAAESHEAAWACLAEVHRRMPASLGESPDVVPVTFWTATPHGGRSLVRDVDAAAWSDIESNYPHADGLTDLMVPEFRPGVGGQLVLWHGEPGTGKTTALRALAREWRDWCDLHYIVDPDVFFGSRADYMMDVMTLEPFADPRSEGKLKQRWRLLVLEDCGELLQPDAKREVGQALARLLNACDGLIGRGLRILVLLTTNEPAEKLHEAVARPGRCAARIEFGPFTAVESRLWLAGHDGSAGDVPEGLTLADLYGRVNGFREQRRERAVGFAA